MIPHRIYYRVFPIWKINIHFNHLSFVLINGAFSQWTRALFYYINIFVPQKILKIQNYGNIGTSFGVND